MREKLCVRLLQIKFQFKQFVSSSHWSSIKTLKAHDPPAAYVPSQNFCKQSKAERTYVSVRIQKWQKANGKYKEKGGGKWKMKWEMWNGKWAKWKWHKNCWRISRVKVSESKKKADRENMWRTSKVSFVLSSLFENYSKLEASFDYIYSCPHMSAALWPPPPLTPSWLLPLLHSVLHSLREVACHTPSANIH